LEILDQIGHQIHIDRLPKRIISLVPSQSELLVDLGMDKKLVGVTRFCTHPKHLRTSRTMVGGTKDLNFELISNLNPDLVVCNKEENNKEDVLRLQSLYPTYTSDVNSLNEALIMISDLGKITGATDLSRKLNEKISSDFISLENSISGSVAYLIWNDPIMVAGQNTFINSVLNTIGFSNVFDQKPGRYPEVSDHELMKYKPDYIFLSSEPYPFKEKNREIFQKKFPRSQVVLVDGRMYSWYGSCLSRAVESINSLVKRLSKNYSN
tara:strand:+ start:27110 stop:27907 length:798 start_codon:yes stop_codon:yes gene_type:complete